MRLGRDGPTQDGVGQRVTFDELHHERARCARFLEAVDVRDVRMIQRGEQVRFAFEARQALGIGREQIGEDLDGDVAMEQRVSRSLRRRRAACPA